MPEEEDGFEPLQGYAEIGLAAAREHVEHIHKTVMTWLPSEKRAWLDTQLGLLLNRLEDTLALFEPDPSIGEFLKEDPKP